MQFQMSRDFAAGVYLPRGSSTHKNNSANHVIKLVFAPNSFTPVQPRRMDATHAIQLGFDPIVYSPGQYK
jgi:hypothetical protein